jgi:hypothetical protein
MSMITDVWHELVRRRLWPLAVLLLGALVAVPFLLAKQPAPVPAPATSSLPGTTKTAADAVVTANPLVALADAGAAPRRRVLGARKDPFQPAPVPKVKAKQSVAGTDTSAGAPAPSGGGTPTGGTSSGGGSPTGSGGTPTGPATPAPPKKTYPANSLTVRYGSDAASLKKFTLARLQPLLDNTNPILVYLGVRKGGKEAVFLLDASVKAQGDGRCDSGSTQCETLVLRKGETEFLDVTDDAGKVTATYELDLLAIHADTSGVAKASTAKAAAAARKAQAIGRRVVDGHIAASGPLRYRFNAATGEVDRLADDAYLSAVEGASGNTAGIEHVLAGL